VNRKIFLPVQLLGWVLLASVLQACNAVTPAPSITHAPLAFTSTAPFEPTATRSPVPAPSATRLPPALPALAKPELVRIVFQNDNDGWGIATNAGGSIVRTVDGGSTWLNANPPGIAGVGSSAVLSVLDTETVWALVPSTDFFAGTLYRTTDGGLSWSSNPVPFGGAFIQFQNGSSGKALAVHGATAGTETVELFQTSDGGTTWVSMYHNDPSQPGASDNLPMAGIKNGMTFVDANTGWVTGSSATAGEIYLYITQNGGTSWSQQKLPLPNGYANEQMMAQAPVFFGKDGTLPVWVYLPDKAVLTFFGSRDGGLTWMGTAAESSQSKQTGITAIADAQHLWSWDGGADLYISADGANTWQTVRPDQDLSGRLSQMQFVPGPAGRYSGWALTRTDEAGHSQLYRTGDGVVWMLLTK
jgi:photosystem II stability/assembly factor-like uncharacterized protein